MASAHPEGDDVDVDANWGTSSPAAPSAPDADRVAHHELFKLDRSVPWGDSSVPELVSPLPRAGVLPRGLLHAFASPVAESEFQRFLYGFSCLGTAVMYLVSGVTIFYLGLPSTAGDSETPRLIAALGGASAMIGLGIAVIAVWLWLRIVINKERGDGDADRAVEQRSRMVARVHRLLAVIGWAVVVVTQEGLYISVVGECKFAPQPVDESVRFRQESCAAMMPDYVMNALFLTAIFAYVGRDAVAIFAFLGVILPAAVIIAAIGDVERVNDRVRHSVVMWYVTIALATMCVVRDRAYRHAFAAVVDAHVASARAMSRLDDLKQLVSTQLPPELASRLTRYSTGVDVGPSGMLRLPRASLSESRSNVAVLYTEPVDFTRFERSFSHTWIAPIGLSHLFALFDIGTSVFRVDRVATFGDAYVAAVGLFSDFGALTADVNRLARFALWQHHLNEASMLPLHSCIVTGRASGSVVGHSRSLRYVFHGPALDGARCVARGWVPKKSAWVCSKTVAKLGLDPSSAVRSTIGLEHLPPSHELAECFQELVVEERQTSSRASSSAAHENLFARSRSYYSDVSDRLVREILSQRPPSEGDSVANGLRSQQTDPASATDRPTEQQQSALAAVDEQRANQAAPTPAEPDRQRGRDSEAGARRAINPLDDPTEAHTPPLSPRALRSPTVAPGGNPTTAAPRTDPVSDVGFDPSINVFGRFRDAEIEALYLRRWTRTLPITLKWAALAGAVLVAAFWAIHMSDVGAQASHLVWHRTNAVPPLAAGVCLTVFVIVHASKLERTPMSGAARTVFVVGLPGLLYGVLALFLWTWAWMPSSYIVMSAFSSFLLLPVLLLGVLPHAPTWASTLLCITAHLPPVALMYQVTSFGQVVPFTLFVSLTAIITATAKHQRSSFVSVLTVHRTRDIVNATVNTLYEIADGLAPRHVSVRAGLPRKPADAAAAENLALEFEGLNPAAGVSTSEVEDRLGRLAGVLRGDLGKEHVDSFDCVTIAKIQIHRKTAPSSTPENSPGTQQAQEIPDDAAWLDSVWEALHDAMQSAENGADGVDQDIAHSAARVRPASLRILRAMGGVLVMGCGFDKLRDRDGAPSDTTGSRGAVGHSESFADVLETLTRRADTASGHTLAHAIDADTRCLIDALMHFRRNIEARALAVTFTAAVVTDEATGSLLGRGAMHYGVLGHGFQVADALMDAAALAQLPPASHHADTHDEWSPTPPSAASLTATLREHLRAPEHSTVNISLASLRVGFTMPILPPQHHDDTGSAWSAVHEPYEEAIAQLRQRAYAVEYHAAYGRSWAMRHVHRITPLRITFKTTGRPLAEEPPTRGTTADDDGVADEADDGKHVATDLVTTRSASTAMTRSGSANVPTN